MAFKPTNPDYNLSPYTGMTRESWIEAGKYMLSGIFQYIDSYDHPVVVPRQEFDITYPHKNADPDTLIAQKKAEIFEGLTRSLFIAAPLIADNPEIALNNLSLREYYKQHILRVCTKGDEFFVGTYEELQEITGKKDYFRAFQQTVETSALVIGLWMTHDQIWESYTKEEKDIIADFLSSFGHGNTVPQNWRFFNMLDLAFLYKEGYPIDKAVMTEHASATLGFYAGNGWYRDGQSFDYYSCWAFNFYAPLWNEWYGYENLPYIAKQFENNSNELMKTYADMFDKDGFSNMWGRSNVYRFASVSAFDGNFLLRNSTMDPGLARRVSSGALLQFLSREDFAINGIPTLGFYKQFNPLVQGYSCAESPFWMGKAFLCLHFPAEHPFWSAKENNGTWDKLSENSIKETVLDGPALCFTNHNANGETNLRTGKIKKNLGDIHGMWNYSKLTYNTKYPWESTPLMDENSINYPGYTDDAKSEYTTPKDINLSLTQGDVESQQYVLVDVTGKYRSLANYTVWNGEKDGVLYRKNFFDFRTNTETHWQQAMYLADFPVSLGIIRADKIYTFRRPLVLTLGSFGFPDNGTDIKVVEKDGYKTVILKGTSATGAPRALAMTIFAGFTDIKLTHSEETNPDSKKSIVVYAVAPLQKQYGGFEPHVFISQTITRDDGKDFTEEELFPVASIDYTDEAKAGAYGPITINLKDGNSKTVCYDGLEGNLQI